MTMRKALFKVGDRVQYTGTSLWSTEINGQQVKTRFAGMEVVIEEVCPPRKGLGFLGFDEDGDELIDRDKDGHNVYTNAAGQGCIIWPRDKDQWELITK